MAIVRFEKEDDRQEYFNWRKCNSKGFVLNINTLNTKAN